MPFVREGRDWGISTNDLEEREGQMRPYLLITCLRCGNVTLQQRLEAYHVSDKNIATALLKRGFVNFKKVRARGNMKRDAHINKENRVEFLSQKELKALRP